MLSNKVILNARILIVDDNQSNVMVLEKTLEAAGYTSILSTTDSREAQDLYQSFMPDLLILDINMPYLDGYQVMEKLNEIKDDDYLPILVLTAQKDKDTRLKSLDLGAKDFLTKPFDQIEALTRIRNMLEVRLLHNEVKRQKLMLEKEHLEAEEIGKTLLKRLPSDQRLDAAVEVVASSKAGGDRAGFLEEAGESGKAVKEWLVVFDASGHGRGAAKFQEVALGAMFGLLGAGHDFKETLTVTNAMLEKLGTGRFLVGNLWCIHNENEKQSGKNEIIIEEMNVGQHPVMVLEPGKNEVSEWDWGYSSESGSTLPLGLLDDGVDGLKSKYRIVQKGSRIVTYSDGVNEAANGSEELFGRDRLKKLIIETRSISPSAAQQAVIDNVKRWITGSNEELSMEDAAKVRAEDDITLAIVDVKVN